MNLFRIYSLIICLLFTSVILAQIDDVDSKVYYWNKIDMDNNNIEDNRLIFEGSTIDLEYLHLNSSSLLPGKSEFRNITQKSNERLIIVKDGELAVKIRNGEKILGPGSIAVFLPGEEYSIKNRGEDKAVYFVMDYKSRSPVNLSRGKEAGGSFTVDWNDLEFKPHDRGGIREYFTKSTSMFERFEMHVTTLNEGINSHPPHTHRAGEIVLMINGNSRMQVGESVYETSAGDLMFVDSNISHGLENTGSSSCMYFAFQFE